MKVFSTLAFTALIPLLSAAAVHSSHAETTLNKCTDGSQITYTDKPCEKLGLKDAGPIKNAVTESLATPKNAEASLTAAKKSEKSHLEKSLN
ncbi:MAG: hypothetical protein WDM70_06710 [Nitrosomonadales bacterium]